MILHLSKTLHLKESSKEAMLVSSFGPFPGEFTSSHFECQETCYQ